MECSGEMSMKSIELTMSCKKARKVGRPKGYKMGDYQLDLQKRAYMQRINEESAEIMQRLCEMIQQLIIKHPDTPFLYNDFPYLTPCSGGTLVTAPWVREYADAYTYIFKPNTSIILSKVRSNNVTMTDLNKIWLDRITSESAPKIFPNPHPDFYKRFREQKSTTMVFANYLLNSMLSRSNTAIYPLDINFYQKFLYKAMEIAKEFPSTHYAKIINSNAKDILLEFEMDPYKYEISGVEAYFMRHNDKVRKENRGEVNDLFGNSTLERFFNDITFENER